MRPLPRHAFVDQEQIRQRDRLVIEARGAVRGGEAAEARREPLERGEWRVTKQEEAGGANMVRMMEGLVGERARLEGGEEFVVVR
jgi:hypothetical protein